VLFFLSREKACPHEAAYFYISAEKSAGAILVKHWLDKISYGAIYS